VGSAASLANKRGSAADNTWRLADTHGGAFEPGAASEKEPWMTARMNRRLYGFFTKRLDEAGLHQVPDGRDHRGKRWDLGALLRTTVGAMLAGAKSLAEVEELSTRMSTPLKRLFGIQRRVPDTTLRDVLCTVDPQTLRSSLHAVVHQAERRKALEPSVLPFGVGSLDGKAFSIPATDD
jgi:hypothetical protein